MTGTAGLYRREAAAMLKHIKHFIEQSWLLIVSSFVFGLLLAGANAAWMPRISPISVDPSRRSIP